jgi:hypothetical protein
MEALEWADIIALGSGCLTLVGGLALLLIRPWKVRNRGKGEG